MIGGDEQHNVSGDEQHNDYGPLFFLSVFHLIFLLQKTFQLILI
jgi:hypothetical protein